MTTAADKFAIQQAKLRNEHGVPSNPEDIRIEAPKPTAAEINPEVYKDVEPMVIRGFLYSSAVINGVAFSFKSLNHNEFDRIKLYGGLHKNSVAASRRYEDLFLAFGVYTVDGINVLANRDTYIPELAKFFSSMDGAARNKVIFELSDLNRRATRAIIMVEGYAMETTSRLRWAQRKGMELSSTAATGIEGTVGLGLNWGQFTWRALNHFEDAKELAEREWENAKFVASAMAGKGMSKVHHQDKQRRKEEKEARLERRDKILRYALLGEMPEDSKANFSMNAAHTVEELADQLERDLKGEKDWHDEVVDAHHRRARAERESKRAQIQQFQADYDQKYGSNPLLGETEMGGLSQAEVQERMSRRRQLMAQRLASRQVFSEVHNPKMSSFMDKWYGADSLDQGEDLGVVPKQQRGLSLPGRRGKD